jgi:hypothetical protein
MTFTKMQKSVSILLGAGFSAPKGYPVGNQLNDSLVNCTGNEFSFHTSGVLVKTTDGKKPDFGYKTANDFEFDFCRDLMQLFKRTKGYFDYEEFYDYFKLEAKDDPKAKELYTLNNYGTERELSQMLFAITKIYQQLVGYYLRDGDGNSWYDNLGHLSGSIYPGYTGILNCLASLAKGHIVNVHTLNHDLFFESFNHSDWLQGDLTDGFHEQGSPYYGEIVVKDRSFNCRLQQYTGNYDKQFRLYKLHGSKDYGLYYKSTGGSTLAPDKYVKIRWGMGFDNILKETEVVGGRLAYERCWVNYHADFLTGTTSKIERYLEPLLFKELFEHFRNNLQECEKLIIVGYGGRDQEVNKMILGNFDYKKKPSFIVDLYPGKDIIAFKENLGASLVVKQLEDLRLADLAIK